MAALVLCWRLADSEVTVTPSVACMDQSHWWYKHTADVVPFSTASVLLLKWVRNINLHHLVKCKWKIGERQVVGEIDVISWLEKGEQIVDICCNVRFVHSSVHTFHDNADRNTGSVMSGNEVFVYQNYNSLIRTNCMDALTFLLH